jgi:histidinol phosphatase-like enzyme
VKGGKRREKPCEKRKKKKIMTEYFLKKIKCPCKTEEIVSHSYTPHHRAVVYVKRAELANVVVC